MDRRKPLPTRQRRKESKLYIAAVVSVVLHMVLTFWPDMCRDISVNALMERLRVIMLLDGPAAEPDQFKELTIPKKDPAKR